MLQLRNKKNVISAESIAGLLEPADIHAYPLVI